MIVAILSISLAFSFSGARDRSNFADQKTEIINLIQEARGLSLASIQVDDATPWVPDYYAVETAEDSIEINAYTYDDSNESTIETLTLIDGFSLDVVTFYYIPPYGETCIEEPPCESGGETEQSFVLYSPDETQQSQFTVSIYGGYPEVEDLEVTEEEE